MRHRQLGAQSLKLFSKVLNYSKTNKAEVAYLYPLFALAKTKRFLNGPCYFRYKRVKLKLIQTHVA